MRDRLNTHYKIGTELSLLSDKQLAALLSKGDSKFGTGWGQCGVVGINGKKVFIKKIPLTDIEMANAYSTKNLYKIPTWYNYGVGSAGFGAFRELAAHIKTTNWVREGSCTSFPLLHHHRILASKGDGESPTDLKGYVAYWNGSKTVERYMRDRSKCKYQLVLFIEALTPLGDWIVKNPLKLITMLPRAINCIDFLKENGMIHFDAHEENWLTDGKDVFLTDFGLALDKDFDLAKSERQFFNKHRYYDYSQVVTAFGNELIDLYFSKQAKQFALLKKELEQAPQDTDPRMTAAIRKALFLHQSRKLKLPASVYKFLAKHQFVIFAKNEFFHLLVTGKKTSNRYPSHRLRRLLKESGVIA